MGVMRKAALALVAVVLVLVAFAAGRRALGPDVDPAAATSPFNAPSSTSAKTHPGLLYGRITVADGTTYEGRLRWGGDEEALWGHYFNGSKDENSWAAHVPLERQPKERSSIEIFGVEIAKRERPFDLGRPFMARFGDIARLEAFERDLWVTLKSGTVFLLDRYSADDFADGMRVWDGSRGVVDLEEGLMRSIELLPTAGRDAGRGAGQGIAPTPLHGTVRTGRGEFTGFVQWDRRECLGLDELDGKTAGGELSVRFDTIRSIARDSGDSSLVTLLDGNEIVLSGSREVGDGNRGLYVDDPRYGRVLVSWDAFERVDFSPGGGGPSYDDFPPGHPLTGKVITRDARRLVGRLVFDLDESETTETLDAPSQGVDFTILFGLVASIALPGSEYRGAQQARVILHGGEELQLELRGDLGERNAGMLIFVDGLERPEYVPWNEVERVDFDRPPAMYPPLGGG